MIVELFPPDSDTAPRHWVRHDQAFVMSNLDTWVTERTGYIDYNFGPNGLGAAKG
jgi:hypothetical protein